MQPAVFRVAQEALTNALKHAGRPATARLALEIVGGRVDLIVTDTGSGLGDGPALQPRGRGLPGMRERAAAYGGTLDAGPLPDGGWRVHLSVAADVDVDAALR